METVIFTIYALAACVGAVAVVVSQNVVRMAFWLVISLGSVSGLFFLLNADFLGATQLLIYVGGTVVLLIFGVMLTASGATVAIKTGPGETVLGGLVGLAVLGLLVFGMMSVDWSANRARLAAVAPPSAASASGYYAPETGQTARKLGAALLGVRFDQDLDRERPDAPLSTGYLLPFEIVSVHLLVVLVGASYLARAKRRRAADIPPRTIPAATPPREHAPPVTTH